jgi:hypothetical protein
MRREADANPLEVVGMELFLLTSACLLGSTGVAIFIGKAIALGSR